MKRFIIPAILIALWLFAWASDTGVLVWSATRDHVDGRLRVCSYFIGVSVETVSRGDAYYATRCRLLSKVY